MESKPTKTHPFPKLTFMNARLDGHMVAAISRMGGEPTLEEPTAVVTDYPPALPSYGVTNAKTLCDSPVCKQLSTHDSWLEEQGVASANVGLGLDSATVVQEFWERFHDTTFTFKGASQFVNQRSLKGGWLTPYPNTLVTNVKEQQRAVVAIPKAEFVSFRKVCPWTEAAVTAVRDEVYKILPEYDGKLEATEYTYFLGVSQASCTKWHTDSAEHPKVPLVLTTLTLLTPGTTSMCIAEKDETWLKKPFDTVFFDPDLVHRSGETHPHVMKLSVHWRVRSSPGSSSVPHGVTAIDVEEDKEAWQEMKKVVVKKEKEEEEEEEKAKEEEAKNEEGSASAHPATPNAKRSKVTLSTAAWRQQLTPTSNPSASSGNKAPKKT